MHLSFQSKNSDGHPFLLGASPKLELSFHFRFPLLISARQSLFIKENKAAGGLAPTPLKKETALLFIKPWSILIWYHSQKISDWRVTFPLGRCHFRNGWTGERRIFILLLLYFYIKKPALCNLHITYSNVFFFLFSEEEHVRFNYTEVNNVCPIKNWLEVFLNHIDCLDKKKCLQCKTELKYYLWADFQEIWSLSKLSKFDIKRL